MEKKLEILINKLQDFNKPKLKAIIVDMAKTSKKNFNRIVSSMYEGLEELKA